MTTPIHDHSEAISPSAPAPAAAPARPGPVWSFAAYSQRNTPPLPGPAGPLTFLIETHADPIFDHPLWIEHGAVPSLRVEVRCTYDQRGVMSWSPAGGPHDTVYGFMTLLVRYLTGFAPHLRGRPMGWFGIPAGFGGVVSDQEAVKYPNAIPLLNHPADRLKSGRRGPFFAEGLRRNLAWSREFFPDLAAALKGRNLPDPIAWILTTEKGVGDDYDGHLGPPSHDTGWVPEALADPRADDPAHLIDGRRTFAQYMRDARTLDGGPIPAYRHEVPLGMPPGRSPLNDESSECYRGAIRLCWDYSRELAFNTPARAAFMRDPMNDPRIIPCGEYQAACDSPWAPVRVRPRTLLHQMNGTFHTDLQMPDWYGGLPNQRPDDAPTAGDLGWETKANWHRVLADVAPDRVRSARSSPDTARQDRAVAVEAQKLVLAAHARSAPHAPLAPFVTDITGIAVDDMVEYLRFVRSVGGWGCCVFMPKPTRESHDYWARVIPRVNA